MAAVRPTKAPPSAGRQTPRLPRCLGLLLGGTFLTPPADASQVGGSVVEAGSGRPLPHVSVASAGGAAAVTDSLGRYEISLPPGRHRVVARRVGYDPQSRRVDLRSGEYLRLDFALRVSPLAQPPTLITATGRPKSAAELTVPAAIVGREAIELSGAANVAEVLEDVAGLNLHSSLYDYLGSPSGVMIQGIDPRRVLILVDGARVIGGSGGVIDLAELPVCQVERVEVVRGPHSALYGSEAMGGVVHVLTRSPREPGGELNLGLGSGGLSSVEGRGSLMRGGLSATVVTARTARDALDRYPQDPDTDIDAHTRTYAQGKVRWEARPGLMVRGSGRWLLQEEEGVSSQYFAPLDKTYVWRFPDRMRRVDLRAGVERRLAGGGTLLAELSRDGFDKLSREELTGSREARDRSTAGALTRRRLRAVHLLRGHALTLGLEHSREDLDVVLERTLAVGERRSTVEVPPSKVDVAEAYLQDDWQAGGRTGVVWGARYQRHSRYGSQLTPKISVAHRLSGSLRVRASYGRGYRAPSLKELHFVFDHSNLGYKVLGNPSLRPEHTRGLNLGLELEPARALDLSVNLFHNRLRNLIHTEADPARTEGRVAVYSYANVGQAVTRGAELAMGLRLGDPLVVKGDYTLLEATDRETGRELPGRPRHAVRARATWSLPTGGRLEVKLRRDSAVWVDAEETLRSPAGHEWDANAEQPLRGPLVLRLGVENLLDSRRDPERPGDLRSLRGREVRGSLRARL